MSPLDRGSRDFNLLHQLAFIRIDGIELEHHVLRFFRCGRIPQIAERTHPLHGFLAFAVQTAFHALRLIDDQDRPRGPDQVDRLLSTGLLTLSIHHVLRLRLAGGFIGLFGLGLLLVAELVDRSHRHDHDLNLGAGRKVPDLSQLCRVIQEVIKRHTCVEPLQMLRSHLDGVVDTLLDRHRRHDDHELGEPIPLVQFEDRPQVDVRLPGPSLHLHSEVPRLHGLRRR